jgi:hypothetical protein
MSEHELLTDYLYEKLSAGSLASNDNAHRWHLGASLLGRECDRELWYKFRWVATPEVTPRKARIFNRGHREEDQILALLEAGGAKLWRDDKGKQITVPLPPHLGGSVDAIIELPEQFWAVYGHYAVVELKSANKTSYAQVVKHGMPKAQPAHYVQGNLYSVALGFKSFIYGIKNKDNEELDWQPQLVDTEAAATHVRRGQRIVMLQSAEEAPRVATKPGTFKCKFCDHQPECFGGATASSVNCRSCVNGRPTDYGSWACALHIKVLTKDEVKAACGDWVSII